MTSGRMLLVALLGLIPTTALAHGPGGHPADPNLHVDPALEDCSVRFASELTQAAFGQFAREFGSVSAFKLMAPPQPLGRGRVAIGLQQLSFTVDEKSATWNDTFVHPDAYHELGAKQAFPKVALRVGVTDDLDLGAFYTRNPQANYGWLGVDARYALLRQSRAMPITLAVRGAYTKTLYVHDMDMHALTADVAAGRTFWNLVTPYVGVGSDLVLVRETAERVDLEREMQDVAHVLGGVQVRLWHVALGAEAYRAELTSYQVQLTALF